MFAIIEFESEESAQKVLSHDEDVLFRGRRLIVKPRRTKESVAAASTDADNDNDGSLEQSHAEFHCQLLSKLTSCANVCSSLLYPRFSYTFHAYTRAVFEYQFVTEIVFVLVSCTSVY